MGRFTGVLGILAVLLAAYLFSTDRRHIRWRTIAWGLGLQITFAFLVLRFSLGQSRDELGRRRGDQHAVGHVCGDAGAVRAARPAQLRRIRRFAQQGSGTYGQPRRHLCVSGSADDHLYLGILRGALSHWIDADHHSRHGVDHAQDDAHLRRGEHERGGEHLHGADGSAADHPAVSCRRPRAAS